MIMFSLWSTQSWGLPCPVASMKLRGTVVPRSGQQHLSVWKRLHAIIIEIRGLACVTMEPHAAWCFSRISLQAFCYFPRHLTSTVAVMCKINYALNHFLWRPFDPLDTRAFWLFWMLACILKYTNTCIFKKWRFDDKGGINIAQLSRYTSCH
jgi:hypothetical protein